ncbi:transcriptional repressor [Vibrio barjaei]|jgi:Fur family ferric uptake transcriptional regulator|uniref:Ferric uptake regulation protein n=1 Tax=Vibrio barjaei TaxID=1676683 RepID=A0ABW7INE4_9VIBR
MNKEIKQRDELVQAGLRVTLPRTKILQILQHQHISAETLYKLCLAKEETFGLTTIYCILNQLESQAARRQRIHKFINGSI